MRGHRLNIFSDRFKYVGLAVGPHKLFKFCCVVNFAVEYAELDSDSEVFVDKLPDLQPQTSDDDYDQDELDEMAEWKGPGGFPYYKGPPGPKHQSVASSKYSQKSKASHNGPNQIAMNFHHKRQAEVKSKGAPPRAMKKDPVLQVKRAPKPGKSNGRNAKCKIVQVPLGRDHSSDEEVVEEVMQLKRKQTMESYTSDKDLAVAVNKKRKGHSRDSSEEESFKGQGFNFQKKKKQYNNAYMERGPSRKNYIRDNSDSEEEQESFKGQGFNFQKKRQNANNMYMKEGAKRAEYLPKPPGGKKSGRSHEKFRNEYLKNRPNYERVSSNTNRSINSRNNHSNKHQPKRQSKSPRSFGKYAPPSKQKSPSRPEAKAKSKKMNEMRSKQLAEMDDFNMPYEAINCLTKRTTKIKDGQKIQTVRKIFTMRDGSQEVHENVFVERVA